MKRILLIILFLFAFSESAFSGVTYVPYCAFENTTPFMILDISFMMNEETNKVIQKENKIQQAQKRLENALDAKIKTLVYIKNVLSQILIMKKEENFLLQKQINLLTY